MPRPADLLTVGSTDSLSGSLVASYRDFADLRDRTRSFDGLAASTNSVVAFTATPGAAPQQRIGTLITADFFRVGTHALARS